MNASLENAPIPFEVKMSARARRMRITVERSGRVVLTMPKGMKEAQGEAFVLEKKHWILKKLAFLKSRSQHQRVPLEVGSFQRYKHKALEVRGGDGYNSNHSVLSSSSVLIRAGIISLNFTFLGMGTATVALKRPLLWSI